MEITLENTSQGNTLTFPVWKTGPMLFETDEVPLRYLASCNQLLAGSSLTQTRLRMRIWLSPTVPHSPRIEHLVPTGNTVEDSENLLKRRKAVANSRTKML